MPVVRVALLLVGSASALVPWRRIPPFVPVLVVAVIGVVSGIVPWHDARGAGHDLGPALAFLVLAVPLAVLLDRSGFFAAIAARVDGGHRLTTWLWLLAAATTIVFNLDAAVVLLTPLYVRIAVRHRLDVVHVALIPALLASLASSVLPVSNLTNLIAAGRVDLSAGSFLTHLALPSVVAILVGGILHLRSGAPATGPSADDETVDPRALRIGTPVVVFLLAGFTLGDRLGLPAWSIAGVALVVLMIHQRHLPWRDIPVGAVAVASGLGVLAAAAAAHLPTEHLLSIRGAPGTIATVATMAVGANAINNLPALLLTLPGLDLHPGRVWAALLGVNIGPTIWVTGALSTLLWQSTLSRLGHRVSAREYARAGIRAGVPALVAATGVLLLTTR